MTQAANPSPPRPVIGTIRPPGPIGLAPVPSTAPPAPADQPDSTYDALTDLFLGEGCMAPTPGGRAGSGPVPTAAAPGPQATQIEGLVLGHLPVLASAWVGQYARNAAQLLGEPVALLRIRAGSVALDLVGGPARNGGWGAEPFSSLNDGIREGTLHARRWILSVEATSEPRIASMLGQGGIDTLTLLTGADEAAVVACYRTIKSLLGCSEARADEDDDQKSPGVQLGVMGAPADKAAEAGNKLAQAAETFLGHRPHVVACVSRIGGSVNRPLYRGNDERSVDELVAMIRRARAANAIDPPLHEPARSLVRPTTERPNLRAAPASVNLVPPAAPTTSGRIGLPLQDSTVPGTAERAGRLAGHIAGLIPIHFRCPYVTRVELAKSPDGRLHVLAQAEEPGGLSGAVAYVAGAVAWARVHADLLGAACPGLVVGGDAEGPISHVFTEKAPEARSLLDSDVRVHLLAQVRSNGAVGLVCVDLN